MIVTDGTGSMGDFPKVIFEKLPLLDLGIADYLDDVEISVAMIGDAQYDARPLQVQPYTKGKGLVGALNNLVIEGGGGGNQTESYDLAALYYARNADMPKATNPVMIFICDEGIYPQVDANWAKDYAKVDIDKKMKTDALFEELKNKYSVYCIRKHYGDHSGDKMQGADLAVHKQWERYVGAERIAMLDDPRRVVDVIFGLLAYETNKMDFFKKELSFRQTPAQVEAVMKSMLTVGKPQAMLPAAKSVLKR
ncbi:TPA: VWA domain-containing protein [Candidatus Woesearchaeota archaeon]|nr:VWA domain-containing protein [Candidatus Woesearchaeota archaeon]